MPIGTTSYDRDHSHQFTVDNDGNGSTSMDHGHTHTIRNFAVASANNHVHEIPNVDMYKQDKARRRRRPRGY